MFIPNLTEILILIKSGFKFLIKNFFKGMIDLISTMLALISCWFLFAGDYSIDLTKDQCKGKAKCINIVIAEKVNND